MSLPGVQAGSVRELLASTRRDEKSNSTHCHVTSQSGVTLNGLHWADNEVAPYNYGDATLMGEAAGLIMRKTAGGKTLYQVHDGSRTVADLLPGPDWCSRLMFTRYMRSTSAAKTVWLHPSLQVDPSCHDMGT